MTNRQDGRRSSRAARRVSRAAQRQHGQGNSEPVPAHTMPRPQPLDADLVCEAERRGYLEFSPEQTRITYICARRFTDDYTDPEEQVRAAIYAWLILDRGYPANRIEVEVPVPRRTPADRADIVVYGDRHPFLVVEVKKTDSGNAEFERGILQGFGNAANLRASYLLVDSGTESIFYDVENCPDVRDRDRYRLGDRKTWVQAPPFTAALCST